MADVRVGDTPFDEHGTPCQVVSFNPGSDRPTVLSRHVR